MAKGKNTPNTQANSKAGEATEATNAQQTLDADKPVASLKLAWAGLLIIAGVALWWTGRLIAAFMWGTVYYPRYFLVQDLGARTCTTIAEGAAPRMICSEGHAWYSVGAISAGIAFIIAGGLLMMMYAYLQRTNTNNSLDPRNALVLGMGSIVVAVCLIVQASVDTITNVQLVNTCYTVAMVVLWVQAIWIGVASLRHQPLFHTTVPVFNTWAAIISLVLVAISLGAFGFYVASPTFSDFGLYQRISLEAMALWALMLGASLTSTRFATDDPELQKATASPASDADAAWQFAPEPDADQQNPGAK